MNYIAITAGAGGALVRSVLGILRARAEAKAKGEMPPELRGWRIVETLLSGAASGALSGLIYPDPISAGMAGYFGSDAIGKGLRLTPGIKKVMPV